jgi:predicted N-acyltransferase
MSIDLPIEDDLPVAYDPAWNIDVLDSIVAAKPLFDLLKPNNPFLSYEFWLALEQNQVIGSNTGWKISYLIVSNQHEAVAWMPLFFKNNNRGEYVFDHTWADAYARYGLNYYPRMVTAIPFTPVTSAKLLLHPAYPLAQVWPMLFERIQSLAQQVHASSWHGLFIEPEMLEVAQGDDTVVSRSGCQFLWTNQNYQVFDDFLAKLTAKKRKSIKVEREKVAKQEVRCHIIEGTDITVTQWQFFINAMPIPIMSVVNSRI